MDYVLNGGTTQQRTWFVEAWDAFFEQYQADLSGYTIQVYWVAEPPCPGHEEFACSHGYSPSGGAISFRNTLDTGAPPYGGRLFYLETVVHEVAHHIMVYMGVDEWIAELFNGTEADWSPTTAWGTRISEATAETIKDLWLPRNLRAYDNRTNWKLPRARLNEFVEAICPTQVVYSQVEYTLVQEHLIQPTGFGPEATPPGTFMLGASGYYWDGAGSLYSRWIWYKDHSFLIPPPDLDSGETIQGYQILGSEQSGPPPRFPSEPYTWTYYAGIDHDVFNELPGVDYGVRGLWVIHVPVADPRPAPPVDSFTIEATIMVRVGIEGVIRCPAQWPYGVGTLVAGPVQSGSVESRRSIA